MKETINFKVFCHKGSHEKMTILAFKRRGGFESYFSRDTKFKRLREKETIEYTISNL